MNIRNVSYLLSLLVLLMAWPGQGREPAELSSANELAPVTAEKLLARVTTDGSGLTLINVWATWCTPCREEFPDLVKIYREYQEQGLTLLLVSADFQRQLPEARQFLAEQGVDFPTYLKQESDESFITALNPQWSGALPMTLLYDQSGTVRQSWTGQISYQTLKTEIEKLIQD